MIQNVPRCHRRAPCRRRHSGAQQWSPWKEDGAGVEALNGTLRAIKRLGRTIWKTWSGYHRRSLVETKMRCFKLPGQRAAARTFERQVTDLKIRAAILNRFSEIGTRMTLRIL